MQDIKKCRNEDYYKHSGSASQSIDHNPGLVRFKELAKKADKVLECGCGEGTKLASISGDSAKSYGIDISPSGIDIAKSKYPNINFQVGSIDKLPYEDGYFDFVYTSFVLEHTSEPEKIISEMIRVTKKDGKIGLICPNFGSMVYRSPCNKENMIFRTIKKFFKHIFIWLATQDSLHRKKVVPIATADRWESDRDTTIEPDMISTLHYLSGIKNIEILEKSSLWELARPHEAGKIVVWIHKICWTLGKWGVYPFKYYGPQMFIIMTKRG